MKKPKTKILVTGSAGFIGSHMYDLLKLQGYAVYGVDDLSGGFMRNVSDPASFTKLDLRDREKTRAYIEKLQPDIIFHLAADATEGRSQFTPLSAMDRNLFAYLNLLIPAIRHGLKKVILTSSMSVYGSQRPPFREDMPVKPQDIYGISKSAMEQTTRVLSDVYGFKYVIVRPHNVYGPRQNLSDPYRNVVGIFINRLLHGKNFFIYGDGSSKRAFSYIDDVAPAIVKAAFHPKCEGRAINIGSDRPITLNKLSEIILEEFFGTTNISKKFQPTHFPDRPQEVRYAYSSHVLVKKLLGTKQETDFRTGIRRTIALARSLEHQPFVYLASLELAHAQIPKTWKAKLI